MRYHVFDIGSLYRQVFAGPPQKRGWVFQERILALRIIDFAENQVILECFEEIKCEAFPKGLPLEVTNKNHLSFSLSDTEYRLAATWRDLVAQYTHCILTRENYKLLAFSGKAYLFQDISECSIRLNT